MTTGESAKRLAALPAVHELLDHPLLAALRPVVDHALLVAEIQACLGRHREDLRTGRAARAPDAEALAADVAATVEGWHAPLLRPVINLTGTLLHTNLGRAPLSARAVQAMVRSAATVNLEYDLGTGKRGERDDLIEPLVRRLTGAESATVVNNNAAAVLLVLASLANRRRVVVSRGELVEIGASFRMPDIVRAAGARLTEVGTTNRTHLADYRTALEDGAALILKVHTSNYRVVGFTHEVALAQLAALAGEFGVPLVADLGSGALVELERFGIGGEPTVQGALRAGADIVTFSGDKLLGGPQAGIIAGRARLLARIRRHPIRRALRCDKLRLAALEATLGAYLDARRLEVELPAYRMLARDIVEIEQLAKEILPHLERWAAGRALIEVTAERSQMGSGAAPGEGLPTRALALKPTQGSPEQLAASLRALDPPVIGRIHGGRLLLDLRALLDPKALIGALSSAPEAER